MLIDHTDYKFTFEEWLNAERTRMRSRSKKFVGDRGYRHFDSSVSLNSLDTNQSKLVEVLKNPDLLTRHSFYPFIRKDKKVRLFGGKQKTGQKVRPIMYASHSDACIYGFFAFILKQAYEENIINTPLNESVIAYRKIPRDDDPRKGKSNIDLAKDVYELTRSYESCAVLCLDIKGFFNNMDHGLIKQKWSNLIKCEKLPAGHYAVYRNITSYRYVFLHEVLQKLGYGKIFNGKFLYYPNKLRTGALCRAREFNKKLAGKNNSIVHKNKSGIGIPQGSPISDIVANLYLEDFDSQILNLISPYAFSHYRRYSDDILIICPEENVQETYQQVRDLAVTEKLSIKAEKTEVLALDISKRIVRDLTYSTTKLEEHKTSARQAFQYLGFEIDDRAIHLRSGTVAAHYRRAKRRAIASLKVQKNIPKKKIQTNHRNHHWQYLLHSKKILASPRLDHQVHKILRRSKSFKNSDIN